MEETCSKSNPCCVLVSHHQLPVCNLTCTQRGSYRDIVCCGSMLLLIRKRVMQEFESASLLGLALTDFARRYAEVHHTRLNDASPCISRSETKHILLILAYLAARLDVSTGTNMKPTVFEGKPDTLFQKTPNRCHLELNKLMPSHSALFVG